MSPRIPQREVGDLVRVMNTTTAELAGHYGKKGKVTSVYLDPLELDSYAEIDLEGGGTLRWPFSGLSGI